jgi:plastocyanin
MRLRRWFLSASALALALGSSASSALPASAATQKTFTIGVDNAAPGGRDWLFVDFFPRRDVRVHRGDVLDFSWNRGSLDGFHSVAFLKTGGSPEPLAIPDSDDGASQIEANPLVFGPSDPTCGTASNPCSFNGSSRLNSGAQPTAPGNEFFVKLDVAPGTLNFYCEVHPGMKGSVTVVPDRAPRTDTEDVAEMAAAQFRSDTRAALEAEEDANHNSVVRNPDGTHTATVTAGTATRYVEIVEMLPRRVHIDAGDKVKYVTTTIKDIHTVTFPRGHESDSVDPLLSFCEATPNDIPAVSPFACSSPLAFETHINPQPQGTNVISTVHSLGSSGIIATPPTPFPPSFAFSFPNAGSFEYQCRIHDNMVGTIVVEAED